ncbi:MAG: prephenate dehydrogenase/arogenate dehydrogenase family protein, partial [Pseudomonadota bacterium]|nr:prephenate dehydrogenase/arogenate dehydrogenase family protein [Pseudomonadota bacterium]
MSKPHIALIGLGLIGSSLGHAFKKYELTDHISGYARSPETRARARELGFVDAVHDSAAGAADGADVVFLNVPLSAMAPLAKDIMPALKSGAVLTDVGSVKQCVLDDILPL